MSAHTSSQGPVLPEHDQPDATGHRLQQARQKAQDYEEEQEPAGAHAEKAVKSENEWIEVANQRIEEAIRQGVFDHLPGAGKPLNLARDPFIPADRQMAFDLLKNNDLTPAWLGERKDLLARITSLRAAMQRTVDRLPASTEIHTAELRAQQWSRQIDQWEDEIRQLNRRITTFNLQQPVAQLEVMRLVLDEELARIGATRSGG